MSNATHKPDDEAFLTAMVLLDRHAKQAHAEADQLADEDPDCSHRRRDKAQHCEQVSALLSDIYDGLASVEPSPRRLKAVR